MKAKVISTLMFLLVIFTYNLEGDYKSQAWNSFYYISLSAFIITQLLSNLSYCFLFVYKFIFVCASIYFAYFAITEIITLIRPGLYNMLIKDVNIYLSGGILILIIFVSLIYLIFTKND